MAYGMDIAQHEEAARRERRAAEEATCLLSFVTHNRLAELHSTERAKKESVRAAITLAFGD